MNPPAQTPSVGKGPTTRRGVANVSGWGLGLVLTGLAVWVAMQGVDFAALQRAEPWRIAALLGCVLGNLVLTGLLFGSVTRAYDADPSVPHEKMIRLIAVSALLNYLPLRPGMIGRAAYLKAHHALPLTQSVWVLLVVLAVNVAVCAVVVSAALLLVGWVALGVAVGGVLVLAVASPALATWVLRRPAPMAWQWALLRGVDLVLGAVRLWLVFDLLGAPLSPRGAVVSSAAAALVALAGITPNGLGLREWGVALLAPLLDPVSAATAAGAALVERAVEVVAVVLVGVASLLSLKK